MTHLPARDVTETSPRHFKVVEGLRSHQHVHFFHEQSIYCVGIVVSTGDETVVALGECRIVPIGLSLR